MPKLCDKAEKISVKTCLECKEYCCFNLYGPIRKDGKLYEMIYFRKLHECENNETCEGCECYNVCSNLVKQSVIFRPLT